MAVILLRALAFLISAFLIGTFFCELPNQPALSGDTSSLSGGVTPPKPNTHNESTPKHESSVNVPVWQGLLELLPDSATENVKLFWQHGRANPLSVVSAGLLTCLTAVFLAGPSG